MEEIKQTTETTNINYDVYNALNLYSEKLGQSYLKNGFNPFEEGFVLTEDYVTTALENSKEQQEITCPPFLENGNEDALSAFELSQSNVQNLVEQITNSLNSGHLSASQEEKLKKALVYLKMFLELLHINILDFKKIVNKLKEYEQLLALNWFLCQEMQSSFTQDFNADQVLDKIKNRTTTTNENKLLQEQAKQIIQRNILAQEESLKQEQALKQQQAELLAKPAQQNKQNSTEQQPAKNDDLLER